MVDKSLPYNICDQVILIKYYKIQSDFENDRD